MKIKTLNRDYIEGLTGYRPFTTFYEDFSVADNFGERAIKDTYTRAFHAWKNDYKYITELTMVLNWKIWEHHNHNQDYANLYNELWEKLDNWCLKHLKGEELDYFVWTTD